MMKKALLILMVSMVLLFTLVSACAKEAAPAEKITLKAISSWKLDHWMSVTFIEDFIADVSKRSKGQLEIEFLGGAEIIKAKEQLTAAGEGTMDMVYTFSGYHAGVLPEISVIGLPVESWGGKKWVKQGRAAKDLLAKVALEKTGAKLLAITGPVTMCFVTSKTQLNTVGDMQGLKMRTTGGWDASLLQALGSVPTKVSSAEIYTAAQRGILDGASRPIVAVRDWGEYEVWKYMVPVPSRTIDGSLFINGDTFNKLPANLQKVLVDASNDFEDAAQKYYIDTDKQATKDLIAKGMVIEEWSAEEEAKYMSIQSKIAREYLEKASPTHAAAFIAAMQAAAK